MILNNQQTQNKSTQRAIYCSNSGIILHNNDYNKKSNPTDFTLEKNKMKLISVPIKTSFQQMIQTEDESKKKVMTKNEIDELRSSVLRTNRPLNPWFDAQKPFRKSYSPITTEKLPTNNVNLSVSSSSISQLPFKNKAPKNSSVVKKSLTMNSQPIYQAKLAIIQDNNNKSSKPQITTNEKTLKNYIQQQEQQKFWEQQQEERQHQPDYDISRALASDIKMLEQLEVEHNQRINNRKLANTTQKLNCPFNYNTSKNYEKNNIFSFDCADRNSGKICDSTGNSLDSASSRSGTCSSFGTTSPTSLQNYFYSPEEKVLESSFSKKSNNINTNYDCQKLNLVTDLSQLNIGNVNIKNNDDYSKNLLNTNLKKENDAFGNNSSYSQLISMSTPNCFVCDEKIDQVILQALGKSYHPQCFRCTKCACCLDGVPFAVDTSGRVFCMIDYQSIYVPACVACQKPISAINNFGQIIRVVFQEQEYHIECFNCEGCGLKLSNEEKNRCHPISSHLLCRTCHFQWKRLGSIDQPITDL